MVGARSERWVARTVGNKRLDSFCLRSAPLQRARDVAGSSRPLEAGHHADWPPPPPSPSRSAAPHTGRRVVGRLAAPGWPRPPDRIGKQHPRRGPRRSARWCSPAATRAGDVTPPCLARMPRTEHAGRGSSFPLTGPGSRGGPRGVWSPRSAPQLRAIDEGIIAAAAAPWTNRAATSASMVGANPQATEAATNTSSPAPNARRAPIRSDSARDDSSSAANISV